jgi:hypothetical protein
MHRWRCTSAECNFGRDGFVGHFFCDAIALSGTKYNGVGDLAPFGTARLAMFIAIIAEQLVIEG